MENRLETQELLVTNFGLSDVDMTSISKIKTPIARYMAIRNVYIGEVDPGIHLDVVDSVYTVRDMMVRVDADLKFLINEATDELRNAA